MLICSLGTCCTSSKRLQFFVFPSTIFLTIFLIHFLNYENDFVFKQSARVVLQCISLTCGPVNIPKVVPLVSHWTFTSSPSLKNQCNEYLSGILNYAKTYFRISGSIHNRSVLLSRENMTTCAISSLISTAESHSKFKNSTLFHRCNILIMFLLLCYGMSQIYFYLLCKLWRTSGYPNYLESNNELVLASLYGLHDDVKYLLKLGADPNITDNYGDSVLIKSSRRGHFDIVTTLLTAGADTNLTNKDGDTALIVASKNGYYDIVFSLLQAGANTELTDKYGETVLMRACWDGYLDIVQLLIDYQAEVFTTAGNGQSAYSFACARGHTQVSELLFRTQNYRRRRMALFLSTSAQVAGLEMINDNTENNLMFSYHQKQLPLLQQMHMHGGSEGPWRQIITYI